MNRESNHSFYGSARGELAVLYLVCEFMRPSLAVNQGARIIALSPVGISSRACYVNRYVA